MTTDFGGYALPSENGFKVVMAIGAGAALVAFLARRLHPEAQARRPGRGRGGDTGGRPGQGVSVIRPTRAAGGGRHPHEG